MVLLNRLVAWGLLGAAITLAISRWHRWHWSTVLNVGWLLLSAYLYWPYALPTTSVTAAPTDLKVLTYNILYSNPDTAAIQAVIETHQADIVGLQEVTNAQWAQLSTALQGDYPYQYYGLAHDYGAPALLSRYPIQATTFLTSDIDRATLVADLEIAGTPLTVVVAHLQAYGWAWIPRTRFSYYANLKTTQQNQQAQAIADYIAQLPHAAIVLCDCNTREVSSSYQLLDATLTNGARTRRAIAAPSGTRKDRDLNHIDYVWSSPDLTSSGVFVGTADGGSDHLPRLGLINWP